MVSYAAHEAGVHLDQALAMLDGLLVAPGVVEHPRSCLMHDERQRLDLGRTLNQFQSLVMTALHRQHERVPHPRREVPGFELECSLELLFGRGVVPFVQHRDDSER